MSQFNQKLQCRWTEIQVDGPRGLAIRLEDGECCDMSGCIEIAKVLMPDVLSIRTFSGRRLDTCYYLDGDEWVSEFPRTPRYQSDH